MTSADVRIDDEFELQVAEGRAFRTLYVRVLGQDARESRKITAEELRLRALRGDVAAQIGWGHRLLQGEDAPLDREAALRWFKIAAGAGDADALNMVGRCYELGWGVRVDAAEAARWFARAAAKGHAWGEFNLASLYAQGRGVPPDQKQALILLVRSARRGNEKAMNMLGRYRQEAKARPRSAALWYRWAAERGCFRAQFQHGRLLAAAGRTNDGIRWLRTSLSRAPQDFCLEALVLLGADPAPELRALAAEIENGERGSAT